MQEFNVGIDTRTDLKNVRVRQRFDVKIPDHLVVKAALKLIDEGYIKDELKLRHTYRRLFNQLMLLNDRNIEREYRYVSNKWQKYWASHHSRAARNRYLKELNDEQFNQQFEEGDGESTSNTDPSGS